MKSWIYQISESYLSSRECYTNSSSGQYQNLNEHEKYKLLKSNIVSYLDQQLQNGFKINIKSLKEEQFNFIINSLLEYMTPEQVAKRGNEAKQTRAQRIAKASELAAKLSKDDKKVIHAGEEKTRAQRFEDRKNTTHVEVDLNNVRDIDFATVAKAIAQGGSGGEGGSGGGGGAGGGAGAGAKSDSAAISDSETSKPKRVRKPLTPEQKQQKNQRARERRSQMTPEQKQEARKAKAAAKAIAAASASGGGGGGGGAGGAGGQGGSASATARNFVRVRHRGGGAPAQPTSPQQPTTGSPAQPVNPKALGINQGQWYKIQRQLKDITGPVTRGIGLLKGVGGGLDQMMGGAGGVLGGAEKIGLALQPQSLEYQALGRIFGGGGVTPGGFMKGLSQQQIQNLIKSNP